MGDMRLTRARRAVVALTIGFWLCLVSIDTALETRSLVSTGALSRIADIVQEEIAHGRIPGVVVLLATVTR